VHALADGVNEGRYPEPELGAEYCELELEIPNTEPELPEDFTASSISSFHACLGPSFINITLYLFYELHIVLLQKKHGRIATLDCYD
jgi:hypothetical protein